ncbi:MAG: T9SS type A sorting domain-containing protein [Bacteroidales bacterium]|nr:T9SS type A sorting domain-containing protein [Bacteroidales bacterium]
MKKFFLLSIILCLTFMSLAEGWRKGEKEIKVFLNSPVDYTLLSDLKINGDINPFKGFGIMYVTPDEFQKLKETGLNYEILKDDLNEYYRDFWNQDVPPGYYTYEEIIEISDSLAENFPEICKKFVFGTSVHGSQLGALKISDNVNVDETEAEILFDGGIHGDEVGASENIIRFARKLCLVYENVTQITNLINNREIWIYYMVNPDGRINMSRYNGNGIDLNRDCGYMWDAEGGSLSAFSQVESKTLRDVAYYNQFVIHTTYHSGMEGVLYPWCYRPDISPDNDIQDFMAGLYSSSSGYSNLQFLQSNHDYPTNGEVIDYTYGLYGSIGLTMEISNSKQPPQSQILHYFDINVPAMLAMIEYAGFGVEGIVTDAITGEPVSGVIFVNDYFPTYSDPEAGDYHKYVLPGTYSITVKVNGYQTQTINNIVVTSNNSTATNFELTPQEGQYIYKISSCQIPDNNHDDEGNTPGIIGAPDNINYSIGKNGWIVIDMQFPILDGPGNDIIVFEGDTSPEGFTCYASESMDGPWHELGDGEGTSEFDLVNGGIFQAQFFKIKDDGDGSASGDNAGFDLDAVAALEQIPGVYLSLMDYYVNDAAGNGNGKIDPGETVDIIATIRNNGDEIAQDVLGEIEVNPSEYTIITQTANFGNLGQYETADGTFTVTASTSIPTGQMTEIILNASANAGSYTNSFTMNFCVGQKPVLIVDFDENHNSAPAIQSAVTAAGFSSDLMTSIPADVNIYTSVFVCLGIYSNNHVLSSSEGQTLAAYLDNGGMLYMEGGDTWYYDSQTAVHSMFNINGQADGSGDLGTINGQSGTFTEDMSFSYSGDNNWIDHLGANSPAELIFENQSPNYGCGVANDAGDYKTIGASFEFGGLDNSESTKEELMLKYLEFFGLTPGQEITQTIPLNTGYQFISSRVAIENPDMLIVLADVLTENLDFVRNSNGTVLRKIGPNWVNGIGDWISTEGYLFKMFANETLEITGEQMDPLSPIQLTSGYQFVSYLPEEAIDAIEAFIVILGDNLDYIRNSNGEMLRKIGPNWVNGIGNANPGEGYLIKMFADDELIYSVPVKSILSSIDSKTTTHITFEGGNAADPVYTIYVQGLEIGDEVAIIDNNKIVGASKIISENALDNSIPIFNTLNSGQGYKEGNEISMKVWNSATGEIIEAEFTFETEYEAYTKNIFPTEDGKYSIANVTKSTSISINEILIYPNPANDIINISSTDEIKNVSIFNYVGQKIFNGNSNQINSSNFETGIYLIRIETNNGIETQKITIN